MALRLSYNTAFSATVVGAAGTLALTTNPGGRWTLTGNSLTSSNVQPGDVPVISETIGGVTVSYSFPTALAAPDALQLTGTPDALAVTGGTPPYYLRALGNLPAGRALSGLTLTGGATARGPAVYTLEASDSLGATARLTISEQAPMATIVPTVDQLRVATLARIQRTATAARTDNPRDVAPLGIVPAATSLTATLPQEVTYAANPERFEVLGGTPLVTTDPAYYVIATADDAPNTGGGATSFMPGGRAIWQYSAIWNVRVQGSRYIEVGTRDTTNGLLRLWVNGRLAQANRAAVQPNAGPGLNWTLYDLGAVGDYEIGVEANSGIRFRGIRVDAGATVSKPTRADTMTVLHLGDSYTSGQATPAGRGDSLMHNLGTYLGAKNRLTTALSGAKLLPTSGVKLIPAFYADFIKTTIAPPADPDIIVIAAGYNDDGSQAPTIAAAYALWQQVRSDFPRALIVVVGMWGGIIQSLATLQNREEGMRAQFNAWADPFSVFVRFSYQAGAAGNARVMFGTGRDGTPAFDGINDHILNADRNHLTGGQDQRNGEWYAATKMRDAVIEGVNALGVAYNPSQVKIPLWPLTIKTAAAAVPAGVVGSPYLLATMATGGAVARTFSILSGTIPPGLTLQTTAGHLSGTPTTAGTYAFTIRAADGVSTADLPVTVVVS